MSHEQPPHASPPPSAVPTPPVHPRGAYAACSLLQGRGPGAPHLPPQPAPFPADLAEAAGRRRCTHPALRWPHQLAGAGGVYARLAIAEAPPEYHQVMRRFPVEGRDPGRQTTLRLVTASLPLGHECVFAMRPVVDLVERCLSSPIHQELTCASSAGRLIMEQRWDMSVGTNHSQERALPAAAR